MDNIEVKLITNSKGNPIDLRNMSLETSKALKAVLDALISICEYETELGNEINIGVISGSAVPLLLGETNDLEVVHRKIQDAATNSRDRDNVYVNNLNIIKSAVETVGSSNISYKKQGRLIDLKPLFSNKFRRRKSSSIVENNFNLNFVEGYLEDCGGKKSINFHLETGLGDLTIHCSKKQALEVNKFLFNNIKVAYWSKMTVNRLHHTFAGIYAGESERYFLEHKPFFKDLKNMTGTEPFHHISSTLKKYYDAKDYAGARKFMKLFLNKYSEPVYLRTILTISKGFKNDEFLGDTLNKIHDLLQEKIGKVF